MLASAYAWHAACCLLRYVRVRCLSFYRCFSYYAAFQMLCWQMPLADFADAAAIADLAYF